METQRTYTAMYDTRGAAETARDGLRALGVDDDGISIRGADTTGSADAGKGLWASIVDLFVPEDDRGLYAEGVRRGGHLLSVRVPGGMEDQVSEVLERAEPVDLDARSESWRAEGWNAGSAGSMPTELTDRALSQPDDRREGSGISAGERVFPAGPDSMTPAGSQDVVAAAGERHRAGKREVGRGSVRVRSYVTGHPVGE